MGPKWGGRHSDMGGSSSSPWGLCQAKRGDTFQRMACLQLLAWHHRQNNSQPKAISSYLQMSPSKSYPSWEKILFSQRRWPAFIMARLHTPALQRFSREWCGHQTMHIYLTPAYGWRVSNTPAKGQASLGVLKVLTNLNWTSANCKTLC